MPTRGGGRRWGRRAWRGALLLFSARAGFDWLDVVFPAWAPQQPTIDLLGALALYCLGFVLLTSHYRVVLGRRTWKTLHFTTYFLAGFVFVHSLLTDPRLNDSRVDYLDAGKLFVEACLLIVVVAVILRARHGVRKARRVPFPAESITEGTL